MARPLLPDDAVDDICARHIAGESTDALASRFKIGVQSVRAYLHRRGVKIHNGRCGIRGNAVLEVRDAYLAGESEKAIADRIGVTRQSVRLVLTRSLLREVGVDEMVPQLAVGPYNLDIAAAPVAVEIFGGGWHTTERHAAIYVKRREYLFNEGWNLFVIWTDSRRHPLAVEAAKQAAAFIDLSRRDPSFRRQERMIWGDGKDTAGLKLNFDHIAFVPSP